MTGPQPDDLRTVELEDEPALAYDPEDWVATTGADRDDHDRLLLDEVPPHWG